MAIKCQDIWIPILVGLLNRISHAINSEVSKKPARFYQIQVFSFSFFSLFFFFAANADQEEVDLRLFVRVKRTDILFLFIYLFLTHSTGVAIQRQPAAYPADRHPSGAAMRTVSNRIKCRPD